MTPDMVAALERQHTTEPGQQCDWLSWRLVGEGIVVDLVVIEGDLGVCVAWMGVHANRPFAVDGEAAEPHTPCKALSADGWCAVDASRGDKLVDAWSTDPAGTRDDAPIWAALEQLAGEVQW